MPIDIVGTENLTNGPYEKPAPNDQGSEVFDVLEEFMERIANHNHDGADSKEITLNIAKELEEFVIGVDLTWATLGLGRYRATIAVPVATTYDASIRKYFYRPNSGGDWKEWYPTVEKINATSFYIYSNDNTIDVKVVTL